MSGAGAHNLTLDVVTCLGDANHAATAIADACPLYVALALRDGANVLLDSTEVPHLEASAGTTAQPPTITLAAIATITIENGDNQVSWPSAELLQPVVVRLTDRNGQPLAGRVLTVTTQSGGGTVIVPPGTAVTTDADGRATLRFQSGASAGHLSLRVLRRE